MQSMLSHAYFFMHGIHIPIMHKNKLTTLQKSLHKIVTRTKKYDTIECILRMHSIKFRIITYLREVPL